MKKHKIFERTIASLTLLVFLFGSAACQDSPTIEEVVKPKGSGHQPNVPIPDRPDIEKEDQDPPIDLPDVAEPPAIRKLRDNFIRQMEDSIKEDVLPPLELDGFDQRIQRAERDPEWREYQSWVYGGQSEIYVPSAEHIELRQELNQHQFEEFVELYQNNPDLKYRKTRAVAATSGYALNEASREALAAGDHASASQLAKASANALSLALDFTPFAGNIKGLIEAVVGVDLVTGEELTTTERVFAGVSALPFGAAVKGARAATRFSINAAQHVLEKTSLARVGAKLGNTKTATRVLDVASKSGASFRQHFNQMADGLDTVQKVSREKLADLSTGLSKVAGRMDLRQGARRLVAGLGDQNALEAIGRIEDPIVALKTVQDLGASHRITGKSLKGQELTNYFDESVIYSEAMLSGEKRDIALKLHTPSAFEAALRGQRLTPKLTRQRAYTKDELFNPLMPDQFIAGRPQSAQFVLDDTTRLIPEKLGDRVVPVLRGQVDTGKVMPSQFRSLTKTGTDEITRPVGELSDEAMEHIEFDGPANLSFMKSDGSLVKLGEQGDKFTRNLPDAKKWSEEAQAYSREFVDSANGIKLNELQPGQILVRNHDGAPKGSKGSGPFGRWFSIRRYENAKEAEDALNVKKFKSTAKEQDIYLVTDRTSAYIGQNVGSKTGKEIQVFMPGHRIIDNPVKLEDVLKRINFDIK